MSFIQDSYRIEDPKDATIQSLRKLVASLNVQLGQMAARLAVLEGSRPSALDAGGYEINNVKTGLATRTSVVTRTDLQNRSLYRANQIDELQSTGRIRASKGVSRSTLGKLPDETVTVAQLAEQEERTGVVITLEDDVSQTGTSFVNITGLSFHVAEGASYTIEATIIWTANTTSHGINLSCTGPTSPTRMSFLWTAMSDATTSVSRSVTAYDGGSTTGYSVAGDNVARWRGTFVCGSTPGTFQMRLASDGLAGTTTVRAGSTLTYKRMN